MDNSVQNTTKNDDIKYEENDEPSSPTEKCEEKLSNALDRRIELVFYNTGSAPIVKRKKWKVEPEKKMGQIATFLKKLLKLNSADSLFLYVNQAFAPPPDQTIENLYHCYGADGKLTVHYCQTQAWG